MQNLAGNQKMHPFLFSRGMGKSVVFRGVANFAVLSPEFIPNRRKCFQGKDAIFG